MNKWSRLLNCSKVAVNFNREIVPLLVDLVREEILAKIFVELLQYETKSILSSSSFFAQLKHGPVGYVIKPTKNYTRSRKKRMNKGKF